MKDDELLTDYIPPEIMQIINFIADKEYQYEQESKEKIKKDIFNKYGDAGLKIFDDLNTNQDEVDCPDCNCNEEDISTVNETICIGCGACVSTCPTGSIALVLREQIVSPPDIGELFEKRLSD